MERALATAMTRMCVKDNQRMHWLRWIRFYLRYQKGISDRTVEESELEHFGLFLEDRGVVDWQRKQALQAVRLYEAVRRRKDEGVNGELLRSDLQERDRIDAGWDRVIGKLVECVKTRQYSPKTLYTYVMWTKRFRDFLKGKDEVAVDAKDAARFFTYLACRKGMVASTQNQAFSALLFLFRNVWRRDFEGFDGVKRARESRYVPVVLSRREVDAVLGKLRHPVDMMGMLLYGCGLRLFEVVNLRVGCLDFDGSRVTVIDGKGRKGRSVPMPEKAKEALERQVRRVRIQREKDLKSGYGGVFLPGALGRRSRNAGKELAWQWLFPARQMTLVPESGEWLRYHAHERKVGAAIKQAAREAGLTKRVTAHSLRHSFASHLLEANYDIRTIQELLGHSSLMTTMVYTHTVRSRTKKEAVSPLDF